MIRLKVQSGSDLNVSGVKTFSFIRRFIYSHSLAMYSSKSKQMYFINNVFHNKKLFFAFIINSFFLRIIVLTGFFYKYFYSIRSTFDVNNRELN